MFGKGGKSPKVLHRWSWPLHAHLKGTCRRTLPTIYSRLRCHSHHQAAWREACVNIVKSLWHMGATGGKISVTLLWKFRISSLHFITYSVNVEPKLKKSWNQHVRMTKNTWNRKPGSYVVGFMVEKFKAFLHVTNGPALGKYVACYTSFTNPNETYDRSFMQTNRSKVDTPTVKLKLTNNFK